MSSIDERIVQMKFDNKAFGAGIKSTLDQLASLQKGLKLDGATKGLEGINTAVNRFSMANMGSQINGILGQFNALQVVAVTALATIAHKAIATGGQLVKSLTLDPVMQGLHEYETNLKSIQTILANTGLKGADGLKQVNAALDELNHYSDMTIYNFSEMAKNIGTFTAAGVKLDVATNAIKGIANLAALSGSSAEQASNAMYQLSQELAAGRVTLLGWNSVVNAGMGGKVFQNALMETARAHGVSVDAIIKKEGSFRDSLRTGWISSEILTETLSKFTGDLTASQLKQMGYTDKQIAGIIEMGKTATDAATKVKTASQLINTLQETATSGWAKTWQLIFGDFDQAKSLWTGVNNVLGDMINASSDARNKVLGDWNKLGGRTVLIDAIRNAFNALLSVLKPIGDAFRQVFPATTGKQLYDLTVSLRNFTEKLKMGGETANNLKRTFAGLFAVFGIGWEILKKGVNFLFELFGAASGGSGSILKITGSIGDFLVALHQAIKNGEGLTKFFHGLAAVIKVPINLIKSLLGFLGSMFDGLDSAGAGNAVDGLRSSLEPLGKLGDAISAAWGKIVGIFHNVWQAFLPLANKLGNWFGKLGEMFSGAFSNLDYNAILNTIQTGLFAGLVLLIKRFTSNFGQVNVGEGLFSKIKDSFDQLTDTLSAMQNALKASTLLQIAAAVGILTLSVIGLSKIDSDGLTRALSAISVMFIQLGASLMAFSHIGTPAQMGKLILMGAALILLAAAIRILSSAVKTLSGMDLADLAKGLGGLGAMLLMLVGVTKTMSGNTNGMIRGAAGLVILAAAIKLLVSAVEDLSALDWEQLAKGLVGVGALLGSLALFTKFSEANKGGISQGIGLVLLATGIKILASAIKDIATLSWEQIAKGLTGVSGGLVAIGAALLLIPPSSVLSAAAVLVVAMSLSMVADALDQMGKMSWGEVARGITSLAGALVLIGAALILVPPSSLLSAAAIYVVAASLGMIADALDTMGGMSWGEIAKSLVLLAGSLTIIAAAMYVMTGALPGAAATLVVAAALKILQPVLEAFGDMSWEEIAKGLTMLAGVFLILGAAGLVLTPVVPTLLALGVAIALLGVGIALAGAGVLAFAMGLTALGAAGAVATTALVAMVAGLIGLIPLVMQKIGEGIIAFAKVIATAGPAIVDAITTVLSAFLDAIVKVTPKAARTLMVMLNTMLNVLVAAVPRMVDAGMKILLGFLQGISNHISKIVDKAVEIIVKFIDGIAKNMPRITQAGANLIVSFVNGVADAIRNNSSAMEAAGRNLGSAIVSGLVSGISGGFGAVVSAAGNLASSALEAAKRILDVNSPSKEFEKIGKYVVDGFRRGIDGNKDQVNAAFAGMQKLLSDSMKAATRDVGAAEAKLKKLTQARYKDQAAIAATRKSLAASRREYALSAGAYYELTKYWTDDKNKIAALAVTYDQFTEKIKTANENLAAAVKTRDDYNKSVKDQYSTLPTIGETKLVNYVKILRRQVEDTQKFSIALQKLRDLGLNDEMYRQLVAKGSSALPFVQDVLNGGKTSVDELNTLGSELSKAASGMANVASTALYQAAVDSAAGLVKGLQNQQAAIEKQMDIIADAMVKAIKKRLGIKSPSREFAKIGQYSSEGLAEGLSAYSSVVTDASEKLGDTAMDAIRKSISDIAAIMTSEMDLSPIIRPVLDLTSVKKSTDGLNSLLSAKSISVEATYSKAKDASAGYQDNQDTMAEINAATAESGDNFTFIQNNTSPKALSQAEIYRQTNNQLSVAKGALTNAN